MYNPTILADDLDRRPLYDGLLPNVANVRLLALSQLPRCGRKESRNEPCWPRRASLVFVVMAVVIHPCG
jgi:hypothetical protein